MAEADRYIFDHKELAEALVQKQGIHEGLWGIAVKLGLAATNLPTGSDAKTIVPAAITFVQKIGIQRFQEANNLTVNAAEVNPATSKPAKNKAAVIGALGLGKTRRR